MIGFLYIDSSAGSIDALGSAPSVPPAPTVAYPYPTSRYIWRAKPQEQRSLTKQEKEMVTHGLHLNLTNSIDGSSAKLFQCLLRVKYGIHPRLHMKVNKLPI